MDIIIEEKIEKALKDIPLCIKILAVERKSFRIPILEEIHRKTNCCKADILNYLNNNTEFKLNRKDYHG